MTTEQTLLAIDPGTTESAYVFWTGTEIQTMCIQPNNEVLDIVRHVHVQSISRLAIEMVQSFGMSVGKEVFETVLWTGRFIEAWENRVGTAEKIYRMDVKRHLCRDTRAKDGNVRQALIDRFGAPGVKANRGVLYGVTKHLWSALAVAVYAHDKANGKL